MRQRSAVLGVLRIHHVDFGDRACFEHALLFDVGGAFALTRCEAHDQLRHATKSFSRILSTLSYHGIPSLLLPCFVCGRQTPITVGPRSCSRRTILVDWRPKHRFIEEALSDHDDRANFEHAGPACKYEDLSSLVAFALDLTYQCYEFVHTRQSCECPSVVDILDRCQRVNWGKIAGN